MKHVINGIIMAAIAFMVIASVMVISGRSIRKNELEKTLEYAAELAIEKLKKEENKGMSSQELIEVFKENLVMGIESDSEVSVSIMMADAEKGILSVYAEEAFRNPLGKVERVEAERTVMIENYSLEKKSMVTVTFQVENTEYKVYTLTEGSRLPVPANPEGKFICWMDENGKSVNIQNIIVDSNKVFTAKMN